MWPPVWGGVTMQPKCDMDNMYSVIFYWLFTGHWLVTDFYYWIVTNLWLIFYWIVMDFYYWLVTNLWLIFYWLMTDFTTDLWLIFTDFYWLFLLTCDWLLLTCDWLLTGFLLTCHSPQVWCVWHGHLLKVYDVVGIWLLSHVRYAIWYSLLLSLVYLYLLLLLCLRYDSNLW